MQHTEASARSLGLLRIWVYGILLFEVVRNPIELLSHLPVEAFQPPGFLRLLPRSLLSTFLGHDALLAFRMGLSVVLATVLLGLVPSRVTCFVCWAGFVVHQALLRGFSGHMNHAEMALVWSTAILAFFPVFDGLSLRSPRTPSASPALYRAPFLFIAAFLSATYFFTGTVRLCKGPGIFLDDSMQNLTATRAIVMAELGDAHTVFLRTSPVAVFQWPSRLLGAGYFGATIMEILFPLAVTHRTWRNLLVPLMALFHLTTGFLVGAAFYYNMCLFVVFSDRGFHRIAERLGALGSRLPGSGPPPGQPSSPLT